MLYTRKEINDADFVNTYRALSMQCIYLCIWCEAQVFMSTTGFPARSLSWLVFSSSPLFGFWLCPITLFVRLHTYLPVACVLFLYRAAAPPRRLLMHEKKKTKLTWFFSCIFFRPRADRPAGGRCAVADERSVRQGLVHAFVSRWTTTASASEASPIDKLEVMRGSAVECTLFSAMAIGGLMLGCPTVTVARHLAAARQCLGRFRSGLCEQSAVAALILYGLANALLPPCDGDGQREYRSSMDDAQEIFGSLEPQDPFVNAFMTYRGTCDNLVAFMPDSLYSVNPVNISGRRGGVTAPAQASTSGGGGGGEGGGDQAWKTPGGATTPGAKQGVDAMRVSSARPAHPAYVVADCEFSRLKSFFGGRPK